MPDLRLDLRYLKCAFSAAELGSFRRAAEALDLSQSTVSRRIQLLEHRLGFALFVRDATGVTLTVAGADFLRDARVVAHQLDRAANLAAALHRGERGELRLGTLAALRSGFLHDLLLRFKQRYPDVHVTLIECTPSETVHRVAMGELDVLFMTGEPEAPGCRSRVLWHESVYAALPEQHALASRDVIGWDDIREEQFIVSRSGCGPEIQDCLIRRLSDSGLRPRIDVHDVSRASLLDLVAMNYGITLESSSTFPKDEYGLVFRLLEGELNSLPRSAVWAANNSNPALRNLLDLAGQIAAEWARDSTVDGRQRQILTPLS